MNCLVFLLALIPVLVVAKGDPNSFNYGFQQCRVTCSDSEDFENLVNNRPVAIGKQGPAGVQGQKGEPGTLDGELSRKIHKISQTNQKLEAELEKYQKLFATPHIRSLILPICLYTYNLNNDLN